MVCGILPLRTTIASVKTVLTDSPAVAAEFIHVGGVVAFPTETVYGLGADVFNESAIMKIFEAKRRPADNPLIVHISRIEQLNELSPEVTESARKFIDSFFPGPLTVVLKKTGPVPLLATAGLDTVGVRMPRNAIARKFLAACDRPIAAPSANLSGRPSPTTWRAVYEDLNGRVDCILKGEATEIGLESTVVDCTQEKPVLLREGAISLEQLQEVVPETRAPDGDTVVKARSPGLRHRHYTPAATVNLLSENENIDDSKRSAYIGIKNRADHFALVKICSSVDEYAREVFEFFRECDRSGIETIYCETVPNEGIGRALMDRLSRAST